MDGNYGFVGKYGKEVGAIFAQLPNLSPCNANDIGSVLGLGAMGYAMAGNIRKKIPATSTLFIYDVHRPSCERFVSEYEAIGPVVITDSVKDLAITSEVVVSIVPTADNVRQVYLDQQNGLSSAPKNPQRLILECSTIESASTREIGETLKASGHGHYVDSPVSVSAVRQTP